MGERMGDEGASLLIQLLQLGEDDEALALFRRRSVASLELAELRAIRRAVLLLAEALAAGEAAHTLMHTAAELLQTVGGSPESTTVPTMGEASLSTEVIRSPAALAKHALSVDGRRMTLPEYAAL